MAVSVPTRKLRRLLRQYAATLRKLDFDLVDVIEFHEREDLPTRPRSRRDTSHAAGGRDRST